MAEDIKQETSVEAEAQVLEKKLLEKYELSH